MKVSVPAGNAFFDISRVVRHWIDTDVLQHDHRRTPLDNAEEDVVVTGPLERDVESETVVIKRQRGGDILYDEEWRNAGNFWFSHVSFRFPNFHAEFCFDSNILDLLMIDKPSAISPVTYPLRAEYRKQMGNGGVCRACCPMLRCRILDESPACQSSIL